MHHASLDRRDDAAPMAELSDGIGLATDRLADAGQTALADLVRSIPA